MSLFVLRRREPNAPRPFRAWGYPVAPAIFTIASFLIVVNALWSDLIVPIQTDAPWGPAAAGLVIIGLGVPIYFFFAGRASRSRD
jgi:APA family basic amino acid/polyamine antiporter